MVLDVLVDLYSFIIAFLIVFFVAFFYILLADRKRPSKTVYEKSATEKIKNVRLHGRHKIINN
ncbi:MAG: hypothetical protein M1355_03040 [Patescibacteria group bacterium]|nr:hypothetical protein [Patescibacteria group bacterium]